MVKPVVLAHLFVRAERIDDWYLHLSVLRKMVPYLFAARHFHCACYIQWHTLEMEHELSE